MPLIIELLTIGWNFTILLTGGTPVIRLLALVSGEKFWGRF